MMQPFVPKRAFFEPAALEYPLGREIYDRLQKLGVEIHTTGSHNRVTGIPGKTPGEAYREAKRTLVVGVRKSNEYAPCKPSAHYQLPLNTGCSSMCEYCYLATTLGKKPYIRVYVNIEDILAKAQAYIEERKPEITVFEGAATSDPIPVEYLTGILKRTIEFFGVQEYGRFRFVTKHARVDSLLDATHNKHTRFRFSLNADPVISRYEHLTPSMAERVEAAGKVARAGYPLGFIIAPIVHYPGWENDYQELFRSLDRKLPDSARRDLTFELITHRFTKRAKNSILAVFPETGLPMDENERRFKYGQFGYGKYLYTAEVMAEIKEFMIKQIQVYFPEAGIDYFV
ncbi:MAG: spore photoproduct lyase [Negativicutes bacterium]|nr:spore photoproduct lyase [Negativicutes bacterium]